MLQRCMVDGALQTQREKVDQVPVHRDADYKRAQSEDQGEVRDQTSDPGLVDSPFRIRNRLLSFRSSRRA